VARLRPPGTNLILTAALLSCTPSLHADDRLPAVPGAPSALTADAQGDGLRILVDRFELEPVTAAELAGAAALPQAASAVPAIATGGTLRADGGLQVSALPASVERELPAVWEFRRQSGSSGGLPRIRVDVEGGLSQPVQVRASQMSRREDGDGTEIFVGGVILVIPIEVLKSQQMLHTRLRVSVEGI
jgi:hypothetical protein